MTQAPAQKTVQVGKRRVAYSEFGQGDPVLMLHGGGPGASGLSNYVRNTEALSAHFRIIVPDMPGYGSSSKGLDQNDVFGDLSTTMHGFLDALGLDASHVVGNSLGGACALRMALDRPARVRRLVLMGPGGISTTRQAPTKGLQKLIGYYKGDGPSIEKLRDFLSYLVHDTSALTDDLVQGRYQASIDPEVVADPPLQGPKSIPAAMRMDFTRNPNLSSLRHPTLILWGVNDRVNRASGGRELAKRLPNADLYEFGNTGHWVQWERPEEFNAITAAFLNAARADA